MSRRAARLQGCRAKLPINLVLVCEGEEEIGSPNFRQIVLKPKVEAALRKCVGIIIPLGNQARGAVQVSLGAKGIIEAELVSSSEKWGRRPKPDVHSSLAAKIDSPAWRIPQALNTLISPRPYARGRGLLRGAPAESAGSEILEDAIPKKNEAATKQALGVERWIENESWHDSLVRLVSRPTINIQGLVGGYTGPGGKTILPSGRREDRRPARAGHDGEETLELIKAHLKEGLRRHRGEHDGG